MPPELTRTLFLRCLDEWGAYPERFRRLPPDEAASFLKGQGYASLRDLLAHVAVWWEEAAGIVSDTIEERERPRRKYDFDEFNTASVARFKDSSEAEMIVRYESQRQAMAALVSSLTEEQLKIRRVSGWLDGVILTHIKEHGLDAPRFLVLDMLEREWEGYPGGYRSMPEEEQTTFLDKQGFPRFRDVVAHIIAWWQDGLDAIDGLSKDPDYHYVEKDTDAYNAQAMDSFGKLEEADVWQKFENTRQSLIEVSMNLPDEIFLHRNVQEWLRADVLEHYYEHAL